MGLMVETGALHAPRPGTGAASYAPIPDSVLAALTADDSSSFHAQIVQQCLDLDCFFVWTDPKSGVVCLRSPTQLAAFYAATGCLAVLLALGADVLQQSPDDQTTALHAACSGCSSSNTTLAIRSLLNAGARLDVLDKYGRTPRDLLPLEAAQVGTASSPAVLLWAGAVGGHLGVLPPCCRLAPRRTRCRRTASEPTTFACTASRWAGRG